VEHAALEELWLDYADGALPGPEARALRVHLEECAPCAARYRRLAAAHRASLRAGRAALEGEPTPVPAAIEERVFSAAREAPARLRPRRRTAVLYPGLATLALAASALLVIRLGAARRAEEDLLRETVSLVAPPEGVRGPEDALSRAARGAMSRWRGGELRERAASVNCPGGVLRAAGLVDGRGDPLLLVIREGEHSDLYAYGEDGRPAGSARLVARSRSQFLLPPRSQAEARALLAAPQCRPGRN